jgi:hypothetical protein
VIDEIVESQDIAGFTEINTRGDYLGSGNDGFQDLHDDAVGGRSSTAPWRRADSSALMKAFAWPVSVWRSKNIVESTMTLFEASFHG